MIQVCIIRTSCTYDIMLLLWCFEFSPEYDRCCLFLRFLQNKAEGTTALDCLLSALITFAFLMYPLLSLFFFLLRTNNKNGFYICQVFGESGGANNLVQRRNWRVCVASNGREEATGRVRAGVLLRWAVDYCSRSVDLLLLWVDQ